MKKKNYIQPSLESEKMMMNNPLMGDASLPSGGEGGPGIAEGKSRESQIEVVDENEENVNYSWGDLW